MGKLTKTTLLIGSAALLAAMMPATASAQQRSFNLPAQAATKSIPEFARQAGIQIVAPGSKLRKIRTRAITGQQDVRAALRLLLEGTGLRIVADDGRTITLGVATTAVTTPTLSVQSASVENAEDNDNDQDIVVTGTSIRGQAPAGANLQTYDRAAIAETGRATVQDFISTLPQNFSGAISEASGANARNTGQTSSLNTLGTGINLRGLGADATLTLINGRRLAPAGYGEYVDVSTIPLSAIERIDVLADGASATYGSDALAGVVNLNLRRRYSGAETSGRIGFSNGLRERQVGQLVGTSWRNGGILATYEFYSRSSLSALDRDLTATNDFRRFGGPDSRGLFSNPGNILSPATLAGAIPTGQNGTALSSAQILRGQTNQFEYKDGITTLPASRRHSAFISAYQEVAPGVELYADVLYGNRYSRTGQSAQTATINVPATNAYRQQNGLGLPGTTPIQIAYDFTPELGANKAIVRSESINGDVGVAIKVSPTWKVDIYASGGRNEARYAVDQFDNRSLANGGALAIALASSNPATAFNPFGAGLVNSAAVLATLRGTTRLEEVNKFAAITAKADGTLFSAPAGDVKIAVGGELRKETYDYLQRQEYSSGVLPAAVLRNGDRTVRSVYGELFLPIFGNDYSTTLLQRLEFTASVRMDNYSDFGTTWNPKVGVNWSPLAGVNLRGSIGTSYKAPRLNDILAAPFVQYSASSVAINRGPDPNGDGVTNLVILAGGNPNLGPEKGRSWTLGLDIAPPGSNLKLQATRFDIDIKDRLGSQSSIVGIFQNPSQYLGIIYFISPSAADVAQAVAGATQVVGTPFANTEALISARIQNISRVHISGFDFSGSYLIPIKDGGLRLSLNGTYFDTYKTAFTVNAPEISVVDTVTNPISWRIRGGISLQRGPLGLAANANFSSKYKNNLITPNVDVRSNVTIDLLASYNLPKSNGLLSGLRFSLSAVNVFDRAPPFAAVGGAAFDTTNFTPLGRIVSLSVTKEW
jgi:iron complex outermembrane receptor protein